MSIAPREAKCSIRRFSCAGHWLLMQRTATWPSSFTTLLPHSGQVVGMRNFFSLPVRASVLHAHHRRNHFAGFFDHDAVADANVFALDLVFIVQRRATDRAAAHEHRLKHGDRREGSGASDLNDDVDQTRFHAFGFVFVSDRPARRFRGEPEPLALRERIDFHDGAVGLIGKIVAHAIEFVNRVQDFLD